MKKHLRRINKSLVLYKLFKKYLKGKNNTRVSKKEMIVLFFILSISVIIVFIILIMLFSKITIILENIRFSSDEINGRHLNKDYKVIVKITLFKVIKVFEINITKTKLEKLEIKKAFDKIKVKLEKNSVKTDINDLKELKNIKFLVSDLDLKVKIGTEDAAFTAILVGILSSVLGILLRNKIKDDEDNKFEVIPIYINQNLLDISLNSTITINMIHIIYTLYVLSKKGKESKNALKVNKRAYAYINE